MPTRFRVATELRTIQIFILPDLDCDAEVWVRPLHPDRFPAKIWKKDKNLTEKEASRRFSLRREARPAGAAGRPLPQLGGKADGHLMACRPCSYRQGMNSEPSSRDKITKLLSTELHSAVGIENDSFWTEVLAKEFDAADDSMSMGDAVEEV
jgi:hypothetical protein